MPKFKAPELLASGQVARCAILSLVVWFVLLYFAQNSHYVGDDFTVLRPLFVGGIVASLHNYVRPLEYFAAFLSLQAQFPVWLVCSCIVYVGTALITLALSNVVVGDTGNRWWRILICCCSPIAAYPYFQVDTLSQALADLFGTLFAIGVLLTLRLHEDRRIRRAGWLLLTAAALCLVSKETSYGLISAGACLIFLRHRSRVVLPALIMIFLLASAMGWTLLASDNLNIAEGAHYGLKKNPFYWLFGVVFSSAVTVAPVPSSILLTGTYGQNAFTILSMVVGTLALAVAISTLIRSPGWSALRPEGPLNVSLDALTKPTNALLILTFASIVPSIFFKVSELYASQMLPFSKAILILIVVRDGRPNAGRYLLPLCAAWLAASAINLVFYAASSGYDPAKDTALVPQQRALYLNIADAAWHQRAQYSTYSVNKFFHNEIAGACEISASDTYVCLPPNIVSGFPHRVRDSESRTK